MSKAKKIVFLTGTRADFGKLKSLILLTQNEEKFTTCVFATGMHMNAKYGKTIDEIKKAGIKNIYPFINSDLSQNMDRMLAKTIEGFSLYVSEEKPDLIVVHGDRLEALAGAITGSMNNVMVAHIEGGEVSGTIDELIRHAVTKMSHHHFAANQAAKKLLVQLGESEKNIHVIGSPDLDIMSSENIPTILEAKEYYGIGFQSYSIAMFHPVTTEIEKIRVYARAFVDALISSNRNYIVIFPNNDIGSDDIIEEYQRFDGLSRFKVFPSLRFEYFLRLLKNSDFIIGNSSAGIREAPFYQVPTIDIGTRQNNRSNNNDILHSSYKKPDILESIDKILLRTPKILGKYDFGDGKSAEKFLKVIMDDKFWQTECQKYFQIL